MILRLFSLCLVACLCGCGKPASPPASAPDAAAAEEPLTPPPAVAAPAPETAPADEASLAALLGQLTQVVRKFAAEQQRVPQSLDELVARGYLSRVPAPPAGRVFAINQQLEVELRRR